MCERRVSDSIDSVSATLTLSGFFNRPDGPKTLSRAGLDADRDVFGGEMASNPKPKVQARMAARTGDEVWSVAVAGGAIEVFAAADLTLLDRLRLPGDMFERIDPPGPRGRGLPPAPEVGGVTAGEDSTIWIVVGAPDRNWSPDLSPRDGVNRWADTVILGVDPDDRAVVVRGRLDDLCLPMSHGRISCVDEMDERIRILGAGKVEAGTPLRPAPGLHHAPAADRVLQPDHEGHPRAAPGAPIRHQGVEDDAVRPELRRLGQDDRDPAFAGIA